MILIGVGIEYFGNRGRFTGYLEYLVYYIDKKNDV